MAGCATRRERCRRARGSPDSTRIQRAAGVAAANTVAFTVLYMRAEDNVHHIIAYLKAVKGVVSDNPELRDTIVVNLVEKRLPDPPINLPLSGQNNLRALGVDWGTLYVSSPQITGASGLWPPMP